MQFRSVVNYFLITIRIIFILVCLFYLGLCFTNFLFSKNQFADVFVRIIVIAGMIWGIFTTISGLIFRTRVISINETHLSIHEIFRGQKKIYAIDEVESISVGKAWDTGLWSKGIKLKFKNGDIYELIWYDYSNFRKMKTAFNEIKKISEKHFI